MDFYALFSVGLAFFIVAVTPGPANLSNATLAMSKGRQVSLVYGAGLSCGLIFWGVIAASGLGAILQTSVYLLSVLKVAGGLYLLWLAFNTAKAALAPNQYDAKPVTEETSKKSWFIRGMLLNLSNPKTVIAWMAALSVGMGADNNLYSLIASVVVCVAVGFFVNGLYSVAFSFGGMMSAYQKASRWISGVMAGLFAAAGLGLISSSFQRSTAN